MNPTIGELARNQVRSSLPLAELNTEEKRARYESLRKKMGRSRLEVTGDPNMHYFWADRSPSGQADMARMEGLGYSIVREPQASEVLTGKAKPRIVANGLTLDGTYVIGDVILTQCSQETYEFICLADSQRHEDMVAGAQRDFKTEAESMAVPVFETQEKKGR
jgi:hypothetical protein